MDWFECWEVSLNFVWLLNTYFHTRFIFKWIFLIQNAEENICWNKKKKKLYYELWNWNIKNTLFFSLFLLLQVRTLFVSGLPMDAKPRELYLLFRAYEVSFWYLCCFFWMLNSFGTYTMQYENILYMIHDSNENIEIHQRFW